MLVETIPVRAAEDAPLDADLYLPENRPDAPLIVAVSGGGWRRGGRNDLAHWGRFFADNGIAFASIDYRRALTGPAFPGNCDDVVRGLSFLSKNGSTYGYDDSRIGLLGASAGAHLSALAMLRGGDDAPVLKAFAGIYGVYDLQRHWQDDLAKSPSLDANLTEKMMGCGPFDNPELYTQASPQRLVTSDKAIPAFLSWGQKDIAIKPEQSAEFARTLEQAGFQVRTRVFSDAGHFWFSEDNLGDPTTFAAQLSTDLLRFFKRQLM